MAEGPEATLPPLYAPWIRRVVGGPVPLETVATCDRCVMLPPGGRPPGTRYFLPGLKCCAFQPTMPNFLVGRVLADSDAAIAAGRAALEARIEGRVGVVPRGLLASGVFHLLYSRTPDVFGRAPALRCPFLVGDADCGIWRHRPGICTTWYCKHVRGETGRRFWRLANGLLHAVESDLALWCAVELGAGTAELAGAFPDPTGQPDVSELGGPIDEASYHERWGEWSGREREFYLAAAKLVEPLEWDGVVAICGPAVGALARLVREAGRRLVSDDVPERVRCGSIQLTLEADGEVRATSYSCYDPLTFPAGLADALRSFDGRPTQEALAAIQDERNLVLTRALVRKLVDFGILKAGR